MKKLIVSIVMWALVIGASSAAVRGTDSLPRANSSATTGTARDGAVATRAATRTVNVVPRATTNVRNTNSRSRTATNVRNVANSRAATTPQNSRVVITTDVANTRSARAATTKTARATTNVGVATNTFNTQQNECQDAYFACMDQFCALSNDKYRRCVCSSRLETIKSRERTLNQTANQLQDFQDLNIDAILKTPAEVKAMLTASTGELTLSKTHDDSPSAKKLTAISDVLAGTRSNALSTAGQLDVGGDIKQIWNSTDLISGANIANLTGESLYNAVHAQCAEMVADRCPSQTTLNMVVSAYGMYIENDCSIILSNLDKQAINANTAIRQTNHEMNTARLENYDAHNSTAINDCIAGVRQDITADTACGENYVHCLDLTGLYLNRVTGAPIYSANFYKLNDQVSLSGDVLTNHTNTKLVAELNAKRKFAENTLETCRDIADEVWDEYLRQAITEIYQGQQSKIRQVKNECMDVVNKCYDEKTAQLRDYSNIEEQMLLGDRLVLSEEMCSEKLNTCSNLYGGGANGLQLLVAEMQSITNQKISQNCLATLQDYAKKLCRVLSTDTLHQYPYGCRVYAPGNSLYAQEPLCTQMGSLDGSNYNIQELIPADLGEDDLPPDLSAFSCWENRYYYSCSEGYFLYEEKCYTCPAGYSCEGGTAQPRMGYNSETCGGVDYIGSLYQKIVSYALQYCMRPNSTIVSVEVLADVNTVMDSIKIDMANVLATDCERLGGKWLTTYSESDAENHKLVDFYNDTGANLGWGLCYSDE